MNSPQQKEKPAVGAAGVNTELGKDSMSNSILSFNFNNHQVRTVTVDGEVQFVLADLCKVLDLSNPRMVAQRLDDDVSQTYPIPDSLGRMQQMHVVNEAGMYEVVLRSDKPEAVLFRRWITGTVLPQIRKTGSYSVQPSIAPAPLPLKEQAAILRTLRTSLHPDYADAKARILVARAMGEEPEIDPSRRPLDVHSYLEELGLDKQAIKSKASWFGREVSKAYTELYGEAPRLVDREVNGSIRKVKGYTEQHRPLFDQVFYSKELGNGAAVLDNTISELRAI